MKTTPEPTTRRRGLALQGVLMLVLLGAGVGTLCVYFFAGSSEPRGSSRQRVDGVVHAGKAEPAPTAELVPIVTPQEQAAQAEAQQAAEAAAAALAAEENLSPREKLRLELAAQRPPIPEGPKMRHYRAGPAERVDTQAIRANQAAKIQELREQRRKAELEASGESAQTLQTTNAQPRAAKREEQQQVFRSREERRAARAGQTQHQRSGKRAAKKAAEKPSDDR